MKTWVLSTFDREDRYCEYNYEVAYTFNESDKNQALNSFYKLCKCRINTGDEIELEERDNGNCYCFTSENSLAFDTDYVCSRVVLELIENEEPENNQELSIEAMNEEFMMLAE